MSHREEWVCCFSSSSALALKNDPDMLSQAGAAHNGQSDDDIGVSLDIENYCTVSLFFEQAYL